MHVGSHRELLPRKHNKAELNQVEQGQVAIHAVLIPLPGVQGWAAFFLIERNTRSWIAISSALLKVYLKLRIPLPIVRRVHNCFL